MSPDSLSLLTRPSTSKRALSPLGVFIDRLLQTFEDRRPGLSEETLRLGDRACERFFVEVYEEETKRLEELITSQEHLAPDARAALFGEVDRLIRTVVVSAYVRLSTRFTPRERNDFYLSRDGLHPLERVGWAVGGMVLGAFVVWAPFIPLWSKEWVLPFALGGLFLPELRRYYSYRRYEQALNDLVRRADREAGRIDVAYLLSGAQRAQAPVQALADGPRSNPQSKTEVH